MEKAIELVQKAGWKYEQNSPTLNMYKWKVLLDPDFWKCLGKSLGYKSSYTKDDPEWKTMNVGDMHERTPFRLSMRFFEHVMNGKDVESFFNQLLK